MYIFTILLLVSTSLFSFEITNEECMQMKYSHIAGGTLMSRNLMKKRIQAKYEKKLLSKPETIIKKLQKKYPELKIKDLKFKLLNCKGYYISNGKKGIYYFEPSTLKLIKKYED